MVASKVTPTDKNIFKVGCHFYVFIIYLDIALDLKSVKQSPGGFIPMVLLKTLQNLLEKQLVRVSFFQAGGLQIRQIETPVQVFSYNLCFPITFAVF